MIFGPLLWVGLNVPLVALFTFTDWDSAALMLFGGIFGGAYGLGYLVGDWWALALPLPLSLGVSVYVVVLNRATGLVPFIADAKRVREQWQTMTLSRQHQIVAALLDHVVVGPARRGYNRFDESRLRPVWRV